MKEMLRRLGILSIVIIGTMSFGLLLAFAFIASQEGIGVVTSEKAAFKNAKKIIISDFSVKPTICFEEVNLDKLTGGKARLDVWVEMGRNWSERFEVLVDPDLERNNESRVSVYPNLVFRLFLSKNFVKSEKVIIFVGNQDDKEYWMTWLEKAYYDAEIAVHKKNELTSPRRVVPEN
jgi:hypothetical protein